MSERYSSDQNPCLRCGACCATFRVSFYWAEAEALGLPATLTEQINPFSSCMAGINRSAPRCHALYGTVGGAVACSVYYQRPSPSHGCRRATKNATGRGHGMDCRPW